MWRFIYCGIVSLNSFSFSFTATTIDSYLLFLQGGVNREKLWDLLANVPGVIMEEGFPNATAREQSIKGMRTSEFCLHLAGDTQLSANSLMPLRASVYQLL